MAGAPFGFRVSTGDDADGTLRVVDKFGTNDDLDSGVAEDIWDGGGAFPWPTGDEALEIVSSSTDDAAAGTGARTVTIQSLDATLAEIEQTVTLNGTTAVAIPTSVMRTHRAFVATVGSGEVNAGTLTIRLASAGATRATIAADKGQTRIATYTIPVGFEGYIVRFYAGIETAGASAEVVVEVMTRNAIGEGWRVREQEGISSAATSRVDHHMLGGIGALPAGAMIRLRGTSNANNVGVLGGFGIVLVAI